MDERTIRVLEYDRILQMLKERTSSVMGREMAESLRPLSDNILIVDALSYTSDAVALIMSQGSPPPAGIHDIRGAAGRVRLGGILSMHELLIIAGFLSACRAYKQYAEAIKGKSDNENRILGLAAMIMTARALENEIFSAIKSDEEIYDNASSQLASIRRKIKEKQESIREKLNSALYSQKYQKAIQEPIITMRDGRYVIPVKQEYRSDFPGIVHDVSSSGATLFIEPMSVVEANNDIRQLLVQEQQEIERILEELSEKVREKIEGITSNISLMTLLDFTFAKAKLSIDFECSCPIMDSEGILSIKKGRHPLLDRKKVVPLDIEIGKDYHTLVITGPNTGGKTVSLKTVGLFTLMAQSGLHLPAAEGTRMPIFKKVFADIGDEQSIAQSLSTFSSHMKHIVEIVDNAGADSLVLLDELGAGTDPVEGAALGMAILENLGAAGATTIATTHYAELKIYAETTPGVENASCEFDIETLRPTYRLLTGIPGRSNAFAISLRLGLNSSIIERAKEFLTSEEIRFEDMLNSIERDRKIVEEARIFADRQRLEAERLKKEIETKRTEVERQKQQMIREARQEAAYILEKAREDAKSSLAKLRSLTENSDLDAKERNREGQRIYEELKTDLDTLQSEMWISLKGKGGKRDADGTGGRMAGPGSGAGSRAGSELKSGDMVKVLSFDKIGEVITDPSKNGEVIVRIGLIKMNFHISDLELVDDEITHKHKAGSGMSITTVSKSRTAKSEIDIRGMTVDEAIPLVELHIEDAKMAGLHELTIIHGKGTGALRKGIQAYLRNNKTVKSFRMGNIGEGDTGVTVAEF